MRLYCKNWKGHFKEDWVKAYDATGSWFLSPGTKIMSSGWFFFCVIRKNPAGDSDDPTVPGTSRFWEVGDVRYSVP